MSAPCAGIHPLAIIGQPPEHRDHRAIDGYPFTPRPSMVHIAQSALIEALVTVDAGIARPTTIGERSWLLKHSHVGHDAIVGDDCELAPFSCVGGHAELGSGVRLGMHAVIKPYVKVGDGARIGAGAFVNRDVPAGETWAGVPARRIDSSDARLAESIARKFEALA
jgi:acyl-[acyl carrier protein]--UDP-N-acetylglucosamine O-acyltransferase